jgi:starch-binding outer membrane protein, SusD/RagB family
MKNIITIRTKLTGKLFPCLLLFAIVLIFSCGEMDFPNPNSPVVDAAPVQTLVTGAESGIRVDLGVYLRNVSVIGREAYYFEPADPRYTSELLRNTLDPGGFLVTRPWTAQYNVIANCNILLNKAADMSGTEKAGVEGFAKTILAHQLLMCLNLQNENGIKLDFTGDRSITHASKEESFTFIENKLDEAYSDLGNAGSEFTFVLSNGFAGFNTPTSFKQFNRAIKARAAIYQNDWSGALTALENSFVDAGASLDFGVYHIYSSALNDLLNPLFESADAAFVKFMGHPSFQSDAESGDTRLAKVKVRSEAITFDDLTSDLGIVLYESSMDPIPIIRNEELLLLRAEANIGSANLGVAESDINVVRAAAGLDPVTLTSDNALSQLLHEKRYSLFLEGHRWFDMRRYGKLDELPLDRAGDVIITSFPILEDEQP